MRSITLISILFLLPFLGYCQIKVEKYKSPKYFYNINIPAGFRQSIAVGKHIDLNLVNQDGSSITVEVTKRLPEEIGIDAHSYTKEFFQKIFNTTNPRIAISKTEKTFIDRKKVFIIYYNDPRDGWNDTRIIQAYLFIADDVYLLTATAGELTFNMHKNIFIETIKSIKFQN